MVGRSGDSKQTFFMDGPKCGDTAISLLHNA